MKTKTIQKWIAALAIFLLLALLLAFLQALVTPKYRTESREGALTADYYRQNGVVHDVLFLGDCEVYESFTPPTLWEQYGISSYIRGNAQQLLWQSYYLLADTLRYETPSVAVLNVYAMRYGGPQNEAYNRMTLDGMKFSAEKIGAVRASMTEGESFASYLFPLLRFHSRWKELSREDLTGIWNEDSVSHAGYLMQTGIEPKNSEQAGAPLFDTSLPDTAWEYLEKIRILCEENGIRLILIKAPTNSWGYYWYDAWDAQIADYAENHSLPYYNLIPLAEEIGIDWSHDTYDAGVHLNVWGAEKLSAWFGALLRDEFAVPDRRGDAAFSDFWDAAVQRYYKEKTEKTS